MVKYPNSYIWNSFWDIKENIKIQHWIPKSPSDNARKNINILCAYLLFVCIALINTHEDGGE